MKFKYFSILLVSVALLGSCEQPSQTAGPQPLTEADKEKLTATRNSYQEAFNAKDLDALVARYTDDAYLLLPNHEMVQGADAIRQNLENQIETLKAQNLVLTAVSTYGVGGLAYDVGTSSQQVTPPGATDPVTIKGKYLVALKKDAGGAWKLSAVALIPDAPSAPPQ